LSYLFLEESQSYKEQILSRDRYLEDSVHEGTANIGSLIPLLLLDGLSALGVGLCSIIDDKYICMRRIAARSPYLIHLLSSVAGIIFKG